ncbi:MAG: hypothetical protein QM605_13160 [Sphingobium sp.]
MRKFIPFLLLTTTLSACNLAPRYVQPSLPIADRFADNLAAMPAVRLAGGTSSTTSACRP